MPLLNRRKTAVLLIVVGLVALGFGLWILFGMFWPAKTPTPGYNAEATPLPVTPRAPVPKTYAAPVIVQGNSTAGEGAHGTDVLEATNRASDVVGRMGSGSSQSGFLGYEDVLLDGTAKFQAVARKEQQDLRSLYPSAGATYGITTRVVSTDLVEGKNGADKIVIKVKTQKAVDAGDRSQTTGIAYWEYQVTLLRQADGKYLVDEITSQQVNQ